MKGQRARHPLARWRWFQVLPLSILVYGTLGALVWLVPTASVPALPVGVSLGVLGVVLALWNWRTYGWWARAGLSAVTSLVFHFLGARFTLALTDCAWRWILPGSAAFLVAWMVPALWPRVADILWREQNTPVSKFGRAFLISSISLAPIAGVIGASAGLFARRLGIMRPVFSMTAALALLVSVGMAFAFSYQLWPERPWAKKGPPEE